jgi:O-antigen/teichoic acid export membrane protein
MEESHGILKKIGADSSLSFGFKILALPLRYLTNLLIARLYGAEQMGTYFIAVNLVTVLSVFCSIGLPTGFLRFAAVLKAQREH